MRTKNNLDRKGKKTKSKNKIENSSVYKVPAQIQALVDIGIQTLIKEKNFKMGPTPQILTGERVLDAGSKKLYNTYYKACKFFINFHTNLLLNILFNLYYLLYNNTMI